MKNFTPEMIEKAKAAKSAEELLEVAKAGGIEMTADEAATYFAQLNPQSGELDDDALDGVAGGCGNGSDVDNSWLVSEPMVNVINGDRCPNCGGTVGQVINDPEIGCFPVGCTNCNDHRGYRTITKIFNHGQQILGVDVELI